MPACQIQASNRVAQRRDYRVCIGNAGTKWLLYYAHIKYFCMVLFRLNQIGALLLGKLKGSASVSVIGLRILGELEVI